ncbi:hypothetical protein [Phage DSL-LC06]|nr:hypothetical protein [Phage DSL-LC06]
MDRVKSIIEQINRRNTQGLVLKPCRDLQLARLIPSGKLVIINSKSKD